MSQEQLSLISLILFVPFILTTVWIFLMVHIYTDKAERLLPNSRLVKDNKKLFSHMGLLGKATSNGVISYILLMPKLIAKKGLVDVTEVHNFPRKLKLILILSWGSNSFFFFALIALNVYRRHVM